MPVESQEEEFSIMKSVTNEKGIALVVALVMLALLTLLGTFALSTSSTELFITGNYRNSQYAFYAADAGIEYGKWVVRETFDIMPGTDMSCLPAPAAGKNCKTDKTYLKKVFEGTNNSEGEVRVEWVKTGRPPAGYADDEYVADYYTINARGTGPGNAIVELESMVVRMRSIVE